MRIRLHTYLFLCLGLIAVVPVLVTGLIRTQQAEASQVERLDRETTLAAQALARETTQLMKTHTDAVQALSRQVEAMGSLDPAVLQPIVTAQHMGADTLGNMWVANADGISLAVDPPLDAEGIPSAGTDYHDRDYFQKVFATNATAYSRAQLGRTTHRPNLQVVEPIRDSLGRFIGLSQGAVDLAEIQSLAEQIVATSPGLRIVVLDSEGRVLAHPDPDSRAAMRDLSDVSLYRRFGDDHIVRTGLDEHGTAMHAAVVPVERGGLNWTVVVGRTQAELDAKVSSARNQSLLLAGLSLTAGLALAAALAKLLAQPIVRLAAVAAAVGRGDFSNASLAAHPGLPHEVVVLLHAVREMVVQIRARTDELKHEATHDPLTLLPNRALLRDRLEQSLVVAHEGATQLALLLLDLDRFKEVNDTFGHPAGDRLLTEVGRRLQAAAGSVGIIARLGGDEFAVVLPSAGVDSAERVARVLSETLNDPFPVEGHEVEIGVSIGIALFPEHGADGPTLLRQADVAMYAAKREGMDYAVYTPDLDRHSPDRLALVGDLRRAINNDELVLHYQPKVEFATGSVYFLEALVRWQHPSRGLVPPDEFVPLVEQTALIRPLTGWVLDQALRQCRAWHEAGLRVGVAVNLSMRNLHDPELPSVLDRLLEKWNVAPSLLRVEITESSLMADPPRALEILTRLRSRGVSVAIDDFGTGYSSLAYLKRLRVDEIKIDKSFVQEMVNNPDDAAIVRSTITLGHDLGLIVVAEGVEDQPTWDMLERLNCDLAQGFYLSRPMHALQATQWLINHSAPAADAAA